MAGLGEEREESTKHTNEHVIKKMGPHSLQRLHEEGAYLKRRFLVPLPSQMEIGSVSPAPFSVVLSSSNKFSQCRLARKEKLQLGNDWVEKTCTGELEMLVMAPVPEMLWIAAPRGLWWEGKFPLQQHGPSPRVWGAAEAPTANLHVPLRQGTTSASASPGRDRDQRKK